MIISVLLAALSLPGVSSAQGPKPGDTAMYPPSTGPYKVGVTMRQWVAENRNDGTTVTVWIWYPAKVDDKAVAAPYLIDDVSRVKFKASLEQLGWGPDIDILMKQLESLSLGAFQDAAISEAQVTYPVVIYSNGLGYPLNQAHQIRELASHGYIIVDINHFYKGALRFPDIEEIGPLANDIVFVLDQLEKLNRGEIKDNLVGHFDLAHIGVTGWSVGGGVVYRASVQDDRIKAGFSEDGPVLVSSKPDDRPWLFIEVDNNPLMMYTKSEQPVYLLQIAGFVHMSLGDIALWSGARKTDRYFSGEMTGNRAVQILNAYLVAFFDQYLRGSQQPLLAGPSTDFPEVTITSRNTRSAMN